MNALNFYIFSWIHWSRVLWFGLNLIIRSSSESLRVKNDTMTWSWPRLPPNFFVHWCLSSFRILLQLKQRCRVMCESIMVFVMLVRTYNCWQCEARGSLFFIRPPVILMLFTVCVCVVALKLRDCGLGGAEIVSQILPLNFCFKSFQWIHEESLSASRYIVRSPLLCERIAWNRNLA